MKLKTLFISALAVVMFACVGAQVVAHAPTLARYYETVGGKTYQVFPEKDWDFVTQMQNCDDCAKVTWLWVDGGDDSHMGFRFTGYDDGKDFCGIMWADISDMRNNFDFNQPVQVWVMDCERYEDSLQEQIAASN